MSGVGAWGRGLLGLLLPRGCAGCDAPDEVLCPSCARLFADDVELGDAQGFSCRVAACASYEGVVRHAVLSWKDHGDEECVRPFADAMAVALRRVMADPHVTGSESKRGGDAGGRADPDGMPASGGVDAAADAVPARHRGLLLVPAPSSRSSQRRRGRRHLDPLVMRLVRDARRHGYEAEMLRALEYRREGGLFQGRKSVETSGATDRAARVGGRVRVRQVAQVRGRMVVVIDDIVTTGATMRACMKALEQAGAHVVAGLALAATPRYGISEA